MKKNEKVGIVIIVIGCVLILCVLLFSLFNSDKSSNQGKENKKSENSCALALANENYKDISVTIGDLRITFPMLNCVNNPEITSFAKINTNDEKGIINVYYKLIDSENLSNSDFYDYTLKDQYPDYYLYTENKENLNGVNYKVLHATEVDDNEQEVQKLYQIMYPIGDLETIEIEMFYKDNILNNDVFNKIANEIKYERVNGTTTEVSK